MKVWFLVAFLFSKCLYRVQKFDSDSELEFEVICKKIFEFLKCFKLSIGQLKTYYSDFLTETR